MSQELVTECLSKYLSGEGCTVPAEETPPNETCFLGSVTQEHARRVIRSIRTSQDASLSLLLARTSSSWCVRTSVFSHRAAAHFPA